MPIRIPTYLVKQHHEEADKGRGRPHPHAEENRRSATLTEWELPGQIARRDSTVSLTTAARDRFASDVFRMGYNVDGQLH